MKLKLFDSAVSDRAINTNLIELCVKYGHLKEASERLKKPIYEEHNFMWLRTAARNSDLPMLKLLIEHGADISDLNYLVIRCVGKKDHAKIVSYLEKVKSSLEPKVHPTQKETP